MKFKNQFGGETIVYPPKNRRLCHNCGKLAPKIADILKQKHPFRGALRVGFGYTAIDAVCFGCDAVDAVSFGYTAVDAVSFGYESDA